MTLTHYALPKQKITVTHSATDYQLESESLLTEVTLRENAVSHARIAANDYEGKTFLQKCAITDNVKIEFKFEDGTDTYTQVFGGWINDLQPALTMSPGEIVTIDALGYGVALKNMRVREEYGTQSQNNTLNKIKEVLTDATYGIVPKYVEKIFASATGTGYTINTTKVADLASDFEYLYFPNKPALKCLEDMVDLVSAANVPSAGCHWIVVPDGTTAYLCLATVGNHENPPADVWPTWWNTDQDGSTIEVKKDMIVSAFQQQRSEANYVLYMGTFRRPANGDIWTENNSGDWGSTVGITVADENGAGLFIVNSYSIKGTIAGLAGTGELYYPSSTDWNLDITKIEGKRAIPRIGFYLRVDADITAAATAIRLGTGAYGNNDYFFHTLSSVLPTANEWRHLSFPIGQYYALDETTMWDWALNNNPDWADIDWVAFHIGTVAASADAYFDGLAFKGLVTRAAYDSTKVVNQKCKIKFIQDDIGKDDTLTASDDSGQIGQLTKAELYRAITTPIVGRIVIPMQETIKGGQLTRIHFGKKSDGTFNINKDMRIIEVVHRINEDGATSFLTLTDDVTNSHPTQPTDAYNAVLKAVAPGFQDRTRGSIMGKEVDIDQAILEKTYAT